MELPEEERPRERLMARGPEALSTAELLAILLGTGRPGKSAVELAAERVTVKVPAATVGVPEMSPLVVLMERPVGSPVAL